MAAIMATSLGLLESLDVVGDEFVANIFSKHCPVAAIAR